MMKNKNKIYNIIIVLVILIIVILYVTIHNQTKTVRLETYKVYSTGENNSLVESIEVIKGQTIKLKEHNKEYWYPNDIKIVEITNKYVKISRKAIKYDSNGTKYSETITEKVEYDELIPTDIDEMNPIGPARTKPKYTFYLKFVKS